MVQRIRVLTCISCSFPALFGLVLHLVKQKCVLNQNFNCIKISSVQKALVSYPVLFYRGNGMAFSKSDTNGKFPTAVYKMDS